LTIVLISHRSSHFQLVDRVLTLDGGRLVDNHGTDSRWTVDEVGFDL
jgi:ABC-type bacteriocin/lantibiotic exporter with double-glycine peptidase domain